MSTYASKIGFFVLFILVIMSMVWGSVEISELIQYVGNRQKSVLVDTGIFYFFILSGIIPVYIAELCLNEKNKEFLIKYVGKVFVIWSLFSLLFAAVVFPILITSYVEKKGYIECATRDRMSITQRGNEYIYQIPPCDYNLLTNFEDGSTKPWEPVLYK